MGTVDNARTDIWQGFNQGQQHHRRADDHEDVLQLCRGGGKAFDKGDADAQNELHDKEIEGHSQHVANSVDGVILEEGTSAKGHQQKRRRHGDHGLALDEHHLRGDECETDNDDQRRNKQRDGVARRPDREFVQHQLHKLHAGEERRFRRIAARSQLLADGTQAVDEVPGPFLVIVDDSHEEPGHQEQHDKLFENVGKLVAVECGLDAEKAHFQNDQPAENPQGVTLQGGLPVAGLVVEFAHQGGDKVLIGGMGFARANGKVGVRNEVWIIPTVGCVNNIATAMAKRANAKVKGSVQEVIAFPHPYGCSQMGDDQEHTRTILADLINHPNAGGVLVLGLGCENSNIDVLKPYIGDYDEKRVKFLVCQEVEDEMEKGGELLEELIDYAAAFEREPISVSKLIIGMKCGGSDGFSGITANPLVGRFSDLLISKKGTTILTEVPEMFGAETILMNRCENEQLFDKTVELINDFKQYFKDNHQTIYENPSPGNKKGGISTLEDKSLGCTQKSGNAPVKGVIAYGEPVVAPGLNLLSAPGNDLVAATALAASGAHIVLFTTGRGTPFASPVPTVKISSNSSLAGRKKNWIDFNAGVLVEDQELDETAQKLFDYVVEVASGKKVCSEEAGFHDMAIFKQGVTL